MPSGDVERRIEQLDRLVVASGASFSTDEAQLAINAAIKVVEEAMVGVLLRTRIQRLAQREALRMLGGDDEEVREFEMQVRLSLRDLAVGEQPGVSWLAQAFVASETPPD
jgi:hypothetical protein